MTTTTKRKQFSYPVNEIYGEEVHTEERVYGLTHESYLEKLICELEDAGIDVSGPRAELTALKNFVTHSRKFKADVKNHILFLVKRCE
ncbi:hypothetical protein [Pectobacterium versatile]|uniref:hypothetical protein n=1 Tax=Pectobacterium versatile TaxID=2488639 RepID=UPI00102E38BE|nr:hypothetical protein [Pectobacterium versatile]TAI99799.1 hypothetical protein EG332_04105 [Pectobacterium versatile]UEQ10450.1 hypothetical protein LLE50_04890 [Pectobacterium versatile]GKX40024.1 hypothetical protein SOASR014_37630 [Pectobacterium carotovorum subsp. carotovorum]GLX46187.1 hypothetical protein Pcaca01_38550 [Pectobacterium carotovorum subsp. carotovorum]